MDSFDFKMRKPEQVRQSVMEKLKKHGKGAGGYKIVFMQPKYSVTTIASYDEAILKQLKGPTPDTHPTSSVVRTISE